MKIGGVLTVIEDTVDVNDHFRRRRFVIEHNDRGRIEIISFELFQGQTTLIDSFKLGDKIVVDFNVKGRKWVDTNGGPEKYFNTLQAWNIQHGTLDV
jgi:hypothetical protein